MKRLFVLLTCLSIGLISSAQLSCAQLSSAKLSSANQGGKMKIESSAFTNGQPIPQKYTCQDADVSPALTWSAAPQNAKSFALITDDPDAPVGTWVHWVFYNLPARTHALPEAVPKTEQALGGLQGRNDFKKIGYNGPCPPPGKEHRYFFKLYALDTSLDLKAGAIKPEVERAMLGHVLAHAELMGTYRRK
jgi:Raf kinase inhibitor-like YbhB/YbcL family protein